MARKAYNLKLAVLARFARTLIPQIPALVVLAADKATLFGAPDWVVPSLMFLGAVMTALEKLLRELKK